MNEDTRRAAEVYLGPILAAAARYRADNGANAPYTLWMPEQALPAFWPELQDLAAEHGIQCRTYPSTCAKPL